MDSKRVGLLVTYKVTPATLAEDLQAIRRLLGSSVQVAEARSLGGCSLTDACESRVVRGDKQLCNRPDEDYPMDDLPTCDYPLGEFNGTCPWWAEEAGRVIERLRELRVVPEGLTELRWQEDRADTRCYFVVWSQDAGPAYSWSASWGAYENDYYVEYHPTGTAPSLAEAIAAAEVEGLGAGCRR